MNRARLVALTLIPFLLAACGKCDDLSQRKEVINEIRQLSQEELKELYDSMEKFVAEYKEPHYIGKFDQEHFKWLNPRALRFDGRDDAHLYVRTCGLDVAVILSFHFNPNRYYGRSMRLSHHTSATEVNGEKLWPIP